MATKKLEDYSIEELREKYLYLQVHVLEFLSALNLYSITENLSERQHRMLELMNVTSKLKDIVMQKVG